MASAMTQTQHHFLLPLLIILHILFLCYALFKRVVQSLFPPRPFLRTQTQPRPPKHLALIIVPGSSRRKPLSLIQQHADEGIFVQSVEMALDHCAEEGISELSIWDTGRGLTQRCITRLERSVMSSDLSATESKSKSQKYQTGTLSPWRICERRTEDQDKVETWHIEVETCLSSKPRKVAVHFLPPAASSAFVPDIAQRSGSGLDERELNSAIQKELHFIQDPELLVIHHMRPGVGLRRSAPELYGYPFWPLRITEIYQHPSPLFSLWKRGSDTEVLRIEALQGAMIAWGRVEQRLGR